MDDKSDYWKRIHRAAVAVIVTVLTIFYAYRPDKSDYWNRVHAQPATASAPTPAPTAPPAQAYPPGQLLYVRHEDHSRGRGLPDTYQFYDFRFFPAPPGSDLRNYIIAVQRLAVPTMRADVFEANMAALWAGNRALSNGHDYEDNFAIGPVITGGAMLRATGATMTKAGTLFVQVRALDPNNLPHAPPSLAAVDWTLHFRPTIVTQIARADGRWLVNPFPQFDGWSIAPVLGKDGVQWIRASQVKAIDTPASPFAYP